MLLTFACGAQLQEGHNHIILWLPGLVWDLMFYHIDDQAGLDRDWLIERKNWQTDGQSLLRQNCIILFLPGTDGTDMLDLDFYLQR